MQQAGQAQIIQGDALDVLRTLLNADYVALANRRLNSTTLGLPLEIAA